MSGQREISIDRLREGMRIARGVENAYGGMLIPNGTLLDHNTINQLRKLGLKSVYIIDETEEVQNDNIRNFSSSYQKIVDDIKEIIDAMSFPGKFEYSHYNRVKEIVGSILQIDTGFDIINMLAQLRNVDEYTYTHSINVGIMAMLLGRWVKLSENKIKNLIFSGLLHDIGKAKINPKILNKKGKLSDKEYEEMKKHPIYGYELASKCKLIPNEVAGGILLHHERMDGSGYPLGIKKEMIPLIARVIAIVDTFDAMVSDRIYRTRRSPFDVFKLFEEELYLYDISLTRVFMKNISKSYIGEEVELSNGAKGEIVFINENHISKPIVKVATEFIDLYKVNLEVRDVFIKEKTSEEYSH